MSLERARALVFGMALGHVLGSQAELKGHAGIDAASSTELSNDMNSPGGLFGDTYIWRTNAMLMGYAHHDRPSVLHAVAEAAWLFADGKASTYATSLAAAMTIALSLEGIDDNDYARRIFEGCEGVSDMLEAALYRLGHALAWCDERAAMEHIGRGRDHESMLALAVYCVMRYPTRFDLAIQRAVSFGDEPARLGYLTGGMMGAKLGLESIPQLWLTLCSSSPNLEEIAMIGETMRRNGT